MGGVKVTVRCRALKCHALIVTVTHLGLLSRCTPATQKNDTIFNVLQRPKSLWFCYKHTHANIPPWLRNVNPPPPPSRPRDAQNNHFNICDFNIDKTNQDSDFFFHNQAALVHCMHDVSKNMCTEMWQSANQGSIVSQHQGITSLPSYGATPQSNSEVKDPDHGSACIFPVTHHSRGLLHIHSKIFSLSSIKN